MGLFGSLYTGAAGMLAQSRSTSYISQNIANVSTIGYKRSEGAFSEVIGNIGRYTPDHANGGVTVERLLRAGHQGSIFQTASATDTAINGNGFFAVRDAADENLGFLYTRNGQFGEDANGVLRNSAGFILYGFPVSDINNLPAISGSGGLTPVDVSAFDETAIPTSFLEIAMNLDADTLDIDPYLLDTPQQLPVNNLAASFSRSFGIVDGQGTERNVRFEFRKIVGPMAHFSTDIPASLEATDLLVDPDGPTPGIANNSTFTLTLGATVETFEFVDTAGTAAPGNNEILSVDDLITALRDFGGGNILEANLTSNGQLRVQANDPTATISLTEGAGAPLSGANTLSIAPDPGAESAPPDFIFEPDAPITGNSAAYPNQEDFPALADTATPNPFHWWEVSIVVDMPDPMDPNSTIPTEISRGLMNFNGDGTLNASDFDITLPNIDFDSTITGEEIPLTIDVERFSQFASPTSVIYTEQDGAPLGLRNGVEISREGYVVATYSNGQTVRLYRLPVVTFNNPEGLQDLSGTVFAETAYSGIPSFQGAGENGAGFLETSSLEQSNVDIAEEFGGLIVSQRAFSLNSQLIQAVNEMTQNLTQLAR